MPAIDAIIISAICVAFIGFGLVLAWADYQSRHISQRVEKSGLDRETNHCSPIRGANRAGCKRQQRAGNSHGLKNVRQC